MASLFSLQPPVFIIYPALRSLAIYQLQEALCQAERAFQAEKSSLNFELDRALFQKQMQSQNIPLNRAQDITQVWYTSAIALRLSRSWKFSALELAEKISAYLLASINQTVDKSVTHLPLDRVWQNFTIQTVPPGWIQLRLSDAGLAEWLKLLLQPRPIDILQELGGFSEKNSRFPETFAHFFQIQQTYARCCALLRLSIQEGWIPPPQNNVSLRVYEGLENEFMAPFVSVSLAHSQQFLCCKQRAEQKLIGQLVSVVDEIETLLRQPLITEEKGTKGASKKTIDLAQGEAIAKLINALSQAFQAFDAACRIGGEVQREQPELARSRLMLVAATQSVLQSGLALLNIPAPLFL